MNPRMFLNVFVCDGLISCFTVTCAVPQTQSTTAISDSQVRVANLKVTSKASTPNMSTGNEYRIGVNDVVDISVWREPELSRTVPVRPDGKISLPLIGELAAEGKTASELDNLIKERLKGFLTQPEVTVIVQQINSQHYFVIGEVERPGSFPLNSATNVVQALAAAGSFKEWAHTNDVRIFRHGESNRIELIHFNYKAWTKKKGQINPPELKNGDLVMVP